MIPYGKQSISAEDINSVVEVLNSDFLTQGPKVPLFEQSVASVVGAKHAIAVNSATSALHLACIALGVTKNDLVWTSPISFVASANCALYCGASVDFVDIDAESYNLSPSKLAEKLLTAKKEGLQLPKVVIPVHLCGQSCQMEEIYQLSLEYGFSIIEDASHAIGGRYKSSSIGCCNYSDVTVFSFHPVKIITTAEGGVATTNNAQLARKIDLLRAHGITRDESEMKKDTHTHGGWYYQQLELGFNYRMNDIQAALGISQMDRLKEFVENRNRLATCYDLRLSSLPLVIPKQISDCYSSRHLYVVRLKLDEIKMTRLEVFETLRLKGIGVNVHYIPIHFHPFYKNLGFIDGQFPEAEKYYSEAISLPLFHGMTEDQQQKVIFELSDLLI
jgi:UDP-4-amino-4,6-dideoxy-N-acetyl-beta-L-altrosamine transaminase